MTVDTQNTIENTTSSDVAAIPEPVTQNEANLVPQEEELPRIIKERLGRQEKKHFKEMQMLQSQIGELQSRIMQQSIPNAYSPPAPNTSYMGQAPAGSVREEVQAAMQDLIRQQQQQTIQQAEERNQQYIRQQNMQLESELSEASNTYEDFDEVVIKDASLPITQEMKQAAFLFPHSNAADVFYHLAKNRDEANRISRLHPNAQAREMIVLSNKIAAKKSTVSNAISPMPSLKTNPAKAPSSQKPMHTRSVSELRTYLKSVKM